MTKTIIFDLGNVIVPFDIGRVLKAFELASPFSADEIKQKIFGSSEIVQFEKGELSAENFFTFVRDLFDLQMDFEEFAKAWNSIFTIEPILSDELIEKLSQKYRLIVLSDTNEIHFHFIREKFPILRHFDGFVVSYEVGHMKPSEEIFTAAVAAAKCLASECLFTDDRIGNVIGAREFGINVVLFESSVQFEAELTKRGLI